MDLFDMLNMAGGLSLFLFGMNMMGEALERRAGNSLKQLLSRITSNRFTGLLMGLAVTAIIQSSSATTVMVVGFVNSGLMTLGQAVPVIMGANIGTTVTAWILSLAGIESSSLFIRLLKPSSFTPVLALIGIVFYMMSKNSKRRDTGMILLGFAVLIFGMDQMSGAVEGLKSSPQFQQLFLTFTNPVLGLIAGAVLTAIIQSSSASVGILQALASTGAVTYGAAIPILMGQHIGTCITAMLASIGTNRNAKRAALVHLMFNVVGSFVWLCVFCIFRAVFNPPMLAESASLVGIAIFHSVISLGNVILLFPFSTQLEKAACRLIPDTEKEEKIQQLDERLFQSPPLALNQCRKVLNEMAYSAKTAFSKSISCVMNYDEADAEAVRKAEEETDQYEDLISSFLLKLTAHHPGDEDSAGVTGYLKLIQDFERIGDHAVNIVESAEEIHGKGIVLSSEAMSDFRIISTAVADIVDLSLAAFVNQDLNSAEKTEQLEDFIDQLKENLRTTHLLRLQKGECSVDTGLIWTDLLTDLERIADHCSNISGCVMDPEHPFVSARANRSDLNTSDADYLKRYNAMLKKYADGAV